jgi:transcriptional antiterminator RfaH
VHSKPRKEEWLYNQFASLQIEAYYPRLHTKTEKPHSRKSEPYFPGYLFVNVDLDVTGSSLLQWLPGSLGLVGFGGEPAYVPDGLVQKIRHHVDEINMAEDKKLEFLKPGDKVLIHSGPFAGYDAIFCARMYGSERVQVLLQVLQEYAIRIDLKVNQFTVIKQQRTQR